VILSKIPYPHKIVVFSKINPYLIANNVFNGHNIQVRDSDKKTRNEGNSNE